MKCLRDDAVTHSMRRLRRHRRNADFAKHRTCLEMRCCDKSRILTTIISNQNQSSIPLPPSVHLAAKHTMHFRPCRRLLACTAFRWPRDFQGCSIHARRLSNRFSFEERAGMRQTQRLLRQQADAHSHPAQCLPHESGRTQLGTGVHAGQLGRGSHT